jgi:hypothetical protein
MRVDPAATILPKSVTKNQGKAGSIVGVEEVQIVIAIKRHEIFSWPPEFRLLLLSSTEA